VDAGDNELDNPFVRQLDNSSDAWPAASAAESTPLSGMIFRLLTELSISRMIR
jgi:hypothetical protein